MKLKRFSLVFFLLLSGTLVQQASAQGAPGSTGPAPNADPTGVPVDGGASLLLAGGAAYALKRLRRPRQ